MTALMAPQIAKGALNQCCLQLIQCPFAIWFRYRWVGYLPRKLCILCRLMQRYPEYAHALSLTLNQGLTSDSPLNWNLSKTENGPKRPKENTRIKHYNDLAIWKLLIRAPAVGCMFFIWVFFAHNLSLTYLHNQCNYCTDNINHCF